MLDIENNINFLIIKDKLRPELTRKTPINIEITEWELNKLTDIHLIGRDFNEMVSGKADVVLSFFDSTTLSLRMMETEFTQLKDYTKNSNQVESGEKASHRRYLTREECADIILKRKRHISTSARYSRFFLLITLFYEWRMMKDHYAFPMFFILILHGLTALAVMMAAFSMTRLYQFNHGKLSNQSESDFFQNLKE